MECTFIKCNIYAVMRIACGYLRSKPDRYDSEPVRVYADVACGAGNFLQVRHRQAIHSDLGPYRDTAFRHVLNNTSQSLPTMYRSSRR